MLDGEVGDAAPRIEPVGRRESVGRADVEAGAAGAAMVASRARRASSSAVVKIAPRNSHEPNSRLTRLVCLPCQPSPAASASGFSITGAVSTNTFTSPPAPAASQRGELLEPALDHVVVVAVLRIDGDRAAVRSARSPSGSLVGPVVHAEHDDERTSGHSALRIGAPLRACPSSSPCAVWPRRRRLAQALGRRGIASGRVTPTASKPAALRARRRARADASCAQKSRSA